MLIKKLYIVIYNAIVISYMTGCVFEKDLKGQNVARYWCILFDFNKHSQLYTIGKSMGTKNVVQSL